MNEKITLLIIIIWLLPIKSTSQTFSGLTNINSFGDLNEKRTKLNILIPDIESRLTKLKYSEIDTLHVSWQISSEENEIKNIEQNIKKINYGDTTSVSFLKRDLLIHLNKKNT
ncbi:hypothetical protein BWI96_16915 [Siphonobacter sp. SORGH_AS_0500]|uniref:hypothetical protein n=1 Tax=Siphonobacter sp. SORGH_AS_0500 TaxID=1864824 RepID=UPI000CB09877|nr:hypothetical protein [Siphonobacter sp. SORGH_AS_0500]PKK35394.1 hypothetical protein BWI96_16915 [Siphonobacter sp. SORGH_AS_0500]